MIVEELKEASTNNTRTNGLFIITKIEAKPFKQKNGCFVSCELSDRSGSIRGVIWDRAEKHLEWLRNKMIVRASGEATRYNDNPQFVITNIEEAKKDFDRALLIPSMSPEKLEETKKYLRSVAEEISDPLYRTIWAHMVGEKGLYTDVFTECPGGVGGVHHAYLGGLMEHAAGLIKGAKMFDGGDQGLDLELLYTGCLVHDIGKMDAYEWNTCIEMNDRGRLLHHIPLGCLRLDKLMSTLNINRLDEPINTMIDRLLHIIVSHHESENQGHRKPMFPEAQAVAILDLLDATINFSVGFMSDPANIEEGSNWTKFSHLVERRFFQPNKGTDSIDRPENDKKDPELNLDDILS